MRKFLNLPIEQQVTRIIIGAVVASVVLGGAYIYFTIGLDSIIAFALLTLVCVPVGMAWTKIKSSVRKSLTTEEETDGKDT